MREERESEEIWREVGTWFHFSNIMERDSYGDPGMVVFGVHYAKRADCAPRFRQRFCNRISVLRIPIAAGNFDVQFPPYRPAPEL
ncbi:hypothetical protein TNCV_5067771 [Trichonephila clavipes]|uniref:Uncharacterized protein n=1 Tax=Trichonephila clavipes TaxID=2585209 RepID=A0A8X6RH68_TRICX|nr:hypothetical protein TNCV_5067771 [Trichonephila clavipes]